MSIFDPVIIIECLKKYIKSKSINPVIISFTLSFGHNQHSSVETPELLVGIVTTEDLASWAKEEDAIEYIWNPAEYSSQEVEYKCVNSAIKSYEYPTREEYISSLMSVKDFITKSLGRDIGCSCFSYVHDLDNHDIEDIISINFTSDQLRELEEKEIPIRYC